MNKNLSLLSLLILICFTSQTVFSDTLIDADTLYDIVEQEFPDYFSPSGQTSQIYEQEWYYRYYPTTDTYIGVNTSSEVYILGDVFGGMQRIDTLDALLNRMTNKPEADVCTTYNGLMWEVKTDDNGLRDKDNTYSWYDPSLPVDYVDAATPWAGKEDSGKCEGSKCDTYHFVQAVNAKGLCGYNDWRLPTIDELEGLVNTSNYPKTDNQHFPNTIASNYWTSSHKNGFSKLIETINFHSYLFAPGYSVKNLGFYVRLVRNL